MKFADCWNSLVIVSPGYGFGLIWCLSSPPSSSMFMVWRRRFRDLMRLCAEEAIGVRCRGSGSRAWASLAISREVKDLDHRRIPQSRRDTMQLAHRLINKQINVSIHTVELLFFGTNCIYAKGVPGNWNVYIYYNIIINVFWIRKVACQFFNVPTFWSANFLNCGSTLQLS